MTIVPARLAVISAGLSRPSSTRLLADRLAEAVRLELDGHGRAVEVQVVELRELAHAIADHLVTGFPGAALREAIDVVTNVDSVIAVTPVFSASYSGLFKSFIDLLDTTALVGKPVLIAATGGTDRHSLVLDHALRPLFAHLRAVVLPTGVYAATADWGSGAEPHSDHLPARITRAAGELAALLAHVVPRRTGGADELVPFAERLAALRPAVG